MKIEQYLMLKEFADNELNQRKEIGLAMIIADLQANVRKYPEIITSKKTREQFLKSIPSRTAESLCMVVHRFLYLMAIQMIAPGMVRGINYFKNYYISAINDFAVGPDHENGDFTWVIDPAKLIEPYAIRSYREIPRNGRTNADMLADLAAWNPQVVLIREGPSAEKNTHTLAAVNVAGEYLILDCYHGLKFGPDMRTRYATDGVKYLHWIYAEVDL